MEEINLAKVSALVESAVKEDVGTGDITSDSVIPENLRATAALLAKEDGTIAGLALVGLVYNTIDPEVLFEPAIPDGAQVKKGKALGRLEGSARSILTGERTALNFLQRLSGIATLTRRFVEEVAGTGAAILDTRKTTPAWRYLEKYAVRVGGGLNHRMGLYDQVLLKGNHAKAVAASRELDTAHAAAQAVRDARNTALAGTFVGVEAATIGELRAVLRESPDLVLVDNMSVDEVRECVAVIRQIAPEQRPLLEVSGGISLGNVRSFAETGVDRISVGALTHSAPALDIALELE